MDTNVCMEGWGLAEGTLERETMLDFADAMEMVIGNTFFRKPESPYHLPLWGKQNPNRLRHGKSYRLGHGQECEGTCKRGMCLTASPCSCRPPHKGPVRGKKKEIQTKAANLETSEERRTSRISIYYWLQMHRGPRGKRCGGKVAGNEEDLAWGSSRGVRMDTRKRQTQRNLVVECGSSKGCWGEKMLNLPSGIKLGG